MKYKDSYPPYVCMQTNSTCYKATGRMAIVGVLFHSTGANNPTLKRYVQPTDGSKNYAKDLAKIGKNVNGNDWNHIYREAGLNAWIGKFADGSVGTVQTMPWEYKPWGCGKGKYGSCNNGWIQFEICEDGLTDANYFNSVYKEACELTAYLCKKFNINPDGTVTRSGVKIPTLTCHNDAYKLGFGNGHHDINHWFPKFGKSMETVRADVARLMIGSAVAPVKQEEPVRSSVVFRAQIGAFKSLSGAESYGETFKSKHKLTYKIKHEGQYYKVLHPEAGFEKRSEADLSAGALQKMGYPNAFVVAGGA